MAIQNVFEDTDQQQISNTAGGSMNTTALDMVWNCLIKLKMYLFYASKMQILNIYPNPVTGNCFLQRTRQHIL